MEQVIMVWLALMTLVSWVAIVLYHVSAI